MSATVCLSANTLYYPNGGGHMWVYLNWALGFCSIGCKVIWLEGALVNSKREEFHKNIFLLKSKLASFDATIEVALWCLDADQNQLKDLNGCLSLDEAADRSDLIINQYYQMPEQVVKRFRKSVLLDIDPGLTQLWHSRNHLEVSPHDVYFTIGETVGQPNSKIPKYDVPWLYTPPCVSLEHWPQIGLTPGSVYSTVSHWSMDLWEDDNGELYANDKRTGFLPYLDLPKHTSATLLLALFLGPGEEEEKAQLEARGWRIENSQEVAATPSKYQKFIQMSRGEFSCVKPSCIRLENAWISDRTICYLASGKPAIVQYTGASRFLPDRDGLLRFKSFSEAVKCLEESEQNYEKHCRSARALAEEYFDAKKVTAGLLERCL
jgi:hypothetical protein